MGEWDIVQEEDYTPDQQDEWAVVSEPDYKPQDFKPPAKNYMARLSEDVNRRVGEASRWENENPDATWVETQLNRANVGWGATNDIVNQGLTSVLNATPEFIKKAVAETPIPFTGTSLKQIGEAVSPVISGVRGAYQKLEQAAPRATKVLDEAGNIINLGANLSMGGEAANSLATKAIPKLEKIGIGRNAAKEAQAKVIAQSEEFNIPTTLGEKLNSPFLKQVESITREVPFSGATAQTIKQADAAEAAATKHFAEYTVNPTATSTAEMKIANETHLNNLYNTFRGKIKGLEGEVPELTKTASELLDRYPEVFTSIQDNKIKKILTDITESAKVPIETLDEAGKTIKGFKPRILSADDLWELRRNIGRALGDAKTGTARGELSKVYESISDDLDRVLAKSKDPLVQEFKDANEAYKKYNVKFDVLRQAYDKAVGTTGSGDFFNPQTYATTLKNLANDPLYKKNIKWSVGEVDKMTGLANILQVVKAAGKFKLDPLTGMKGFKYSILKDVLTKFALPPAWVVTFLTQTQKGQKIAMGASKIMPSSEGMANILKQLTKERGFKGGGSIPPKPTIDPLAGDTSGTRPTPLGLPMPERGFSLSGEPYGEVLHPTGLNPLNTREGAINAEFTVLNPQKQIRGYDQPLQLPPGGQFTTGEVIPNISNSKLKRIWEETPEEVYLKGLRDNKRRFK